LHKKPKFFLKAPSKKLTALTNKSTKPVTIKHNYEFRRVTQIDGLLWMVFMTYSNYQIVAHVSLAKTGENERFKVEYLPMESKLGINELENFTEKDFDVEVKRIHFDVLDKKLELRVDSKEEFLKREKAERKIQNVIVELKGRNQNIGRCRLMCRWFGWGWDGDYLIEDRGGRRPFGLYIHSSSTKNRPRRTYWITETAF
jgi:hypothetical protein